jgi:hypothetical protein
MAEIATLTVKMPRFRIAVMRYTLMALSPFIRSETTGQRIGDALFAWVGRGLHVYANGKRI